MHWCACVLSSLRSDLNSLHPNTPDFTIFLFIFCLKSLRTTQPALSYLHPPAAQHALQQRRAPRNLPPLACRTCSPTPTRSPLCPIGEIQERPSNNTGRDHQRNLRFFSTFPSTACTPRFYNLKFCSPQVNQKIKKSHEVNQSNWAAHANSCYLWASKNTICTYSNGLGSTVVSVLLTAHGI